MLTLNKSKFYIFDPQPFKLVLLPCVIHLWKD